MFEKLQFIIMTAVLSSITLYIVQSYKYLSNDTEDIITHIDTFIKNMVFIAMCSVLVSASVIFKGFMSSSFFENSDLYKYMSYMSSILVFFVFLLTLLAIRTKRVTYNNDSALTTKLLVSMILFLFIPIDLFKQLYFVILFTFILSVVIFMIKTGYIRKAWTNQGIYFLISGSFGLVLSSLLSFQFLGSYFNIFSISLMSFILFGYFIFFVSHFLEELKSSLRELKSRDSIIQNKDEALARMALYDDLTGIPNRLAFEKNLVESHDKAYVGLFNLHGFMNYNKLLGYNRGNMILHDLAKTLVSIAPDAFKMYRYYSDKFLILFDTEDYFEALESVDKIHDTLSSVNFQGITLSAYIGLCRLDQVPTSTDRSEILSALEVASTMAKNSQKPVYVYADNDHKNHNDLVNLELMLKKAIDNRAFEIFYQPQYCSKSHKALSYEALIRWNHEGAFIPPSDFIPLAEERGLISAITRQVVDSVFRDYATDAVFKNKKVSINLSADQLIEEHFIDYVKDRLKKYSISPAQIVFEITETSLFNDINKVTQTLHSIKQIGFEISLDDFGHGYSSLFRFSKLDINEIKFDKSFIDDIDNVKTYNTLKKTAELFKGFDMRIVIEGIETSDQLEALKDIDVDLIQGYYFSRPVPKHKL